MLELHLLWPGRLLDEHLHRERRRRSEAQKTMRDAKSPDTELSALWRSGWLWSLKGEFDESEVQSPRPNIFFTNPWRNHCGLCTDKFSVALPFLSILSISEYLLEGLAQLEFLFCMFPLVQNACRSLSRKLTTTWQKKGSSVLLVFKSVHFQT